MAAASIGSTAFAGGDGAESVETPSLPSSSPSALPSRRRQRFDAAMATEPVEKSVLAELAWSGVPEGLRCDVWQMLLGYRPLTLGRRAEALRRKRQEYAELRRNLYEASPALAADTEMQSASDASREESLLLKQIRKDLPRTRLRCAGPAEKLVEDPRILAMMERVLFIWAVRQPASGYVQGLNDVLLPLLLVGLADKATRPVECLGLELLEELGTELVEIEADSYWCLAKILSEIFDHYTHGQPGIQRMVQRLKDVIQRIDGALASHLEEQGVDLLSTAFRWITCLMVREFPVACCLRLWDTLIAESAQSAQGVQGSAGFEALLMYFCACFTAYFSSRLQAMDFEAITLFFQQMPTDAFTESEVEVLLSEAYVLKALFQQAPRHLSNGDSPHAASVR